MILFNSLERQLEHLKEDAKSKNKIIELLISKSNINHENVKHHWNINNSLSTSQHFLLRPKKTAQTKSVNANSNYISENRFKVLSVDNDRDIIGDYHEDKSTEPTRREDNNVTKRNQRKK